MPQQYIMAQNIHDLMTFIAYGYFLHAGVTRFAKIS